MQQKNICLPLCPLLAFPPHLSFMPLFLALFHPAVFIYFSALFHFLSFTQHPSSSSWHTSRRASHLFSLKCFCIQGRAIHRGVAVSPAFGVVRLWLSPKALFFFFLGQHQFCAIALSSSVSIAWDVAVCLCRHMQASLVAVREKLLQCVCVSVCVCCVARVS